MKELAEEIFDAWQQGEKNGNYEKFKGYLTDVFSLFTHPLIGKYKDFEALQKIKELITEREQNKNNLIFSEAVILEAENTFVFQFDSNGTVQNGNFPYQGFNIIILHFQNKTLRGFQQYFGFIDTNWFKN